MRIYSAAKTVADCFKHRNKIGLDVALEALRDCRRKKKASVDDVWRRAGLPGGERHAALHGSDAMSKKKPTNIPVSIRNRLFAHARTQEEDFQFVLIRYALERLLYRLSQSPHGGLFTLKGAMLFGLWSNDRHRPTKDLDLLGQGEVDVPRFEQVFREICPIPCAEDGIAFKSDTVKAEKRREDDLYEGLHVELEAELAGSRIFVQIDIGFGDAITPGPVVAVYPTLLDLPAPTLRTYPRETVVAEKFQAMVALGATNSRLKDFFDLWVLAQVRLRRPRLVRGCPGNLRATADAYPFRHSVRSDRGVLRRCGKGQELAILSQAE